MKRFIAASVLGGAIIILVAMGVAFAGGGASSPNARTTAAEAVSPQVLREAAQLRAQGPAGLTEALRRRPGNDNRTGKQYAAATREWRALVDAVAGQRDALTSLLYWYTDLEAAQAAAQKAGKPILSLRLLGHLTEEHCCANSRYFRKTLYPNREVGNFLRENFILHWESVRPVPTVTIDFGDGRTLKRTITGNSVHYVLDCQGRLVDALPGLYGPKEFLRALQPAKLAASKCALLDDRAYSASVVRYHVQRRNELDTRLRAELVKLGPNAAQLSGTAELLARLPLPVQTAQAAKPTVTTARNARAGASEMATPTLPDPAWPVWSALATGRVEQLEDDADAMAAVGRRNVGADRANRIAVPKSIVEAPDISRMALSDFSRNRAIDSVYNEYALHYCIHQHLGNRDSLLQPLSDFTSWVYAEIFLAPLDDPWYGLKSGAYDGYDMTPEELTAKVAN